jgi:hypothetical protein
MSRITPFAMTRAASVAPKGSAAASAGREVAGTTPSLMGGSVTRSGSLGSAGGAGVAAALAAAAAEQDSLHDQQEHTGQQQQPRALFRLPSSQDVRVEQPSPAARTGSGTPASVLRRTASGSAVQRASPGLEGSQRQLFEGTPAPDASPQPQRRLSRQFEPQSSQRVGSMRRLSGLAPGSPPLPPSPGSSSIDYDADFDDKGTLSFVHAIRCALIVPKEVTTCSEDVDLRLCTAVQLVYCPQA